MFIGKKLGGKKKKRMNSSDLLPIQKLHDSQKDSYPNEGRIPAQCMYGINFTQYQKLSKCDIVSAICISAYGTERTKDTFIITVKCSPVLQFSTFQDRRVAPNSKAK